MAQKKTFIDKIDSPAAFFISQPETAPERKEEPMKKPIPPEGFKVNPLFIETRSKRLQLLVQPSLAEKLKKKAKEEGRSVNDIVHTILEEALKED